MKHWTFYPGVTNAILVLGDTRDERFGCAVRLHFAAMRRRKGGVCDLVSQVKLNT